MSTDDKKPSTILAEYAKSARASCKAKKKCLVDPENAKIEKGALKLGISYESSSGFETAAFKHYECQPATWLAAHLASVDEIVGFKDLKVEDQEMLRARFDQLDQEIKNLQQKAQGEKEEKARAKEVVKEAKKAERVAESAKKKAEMAAAKEALGDKKPAGKKNKVSKKSKGGVSSEAVVPGI